MVKNWASDISSKSGFAGVGLFDLEISRGFSWMLILRRELSTNIVKLTCSLAIINITIATLSAP